jgi:hypothetical protein
MSSPRIDWNYFCTALSADPQLAKRPSLATTVFVPCQLLCSA